MAKIVCSLFFVTVALLCLVTGKPLPDDDQDAKELLNGQDTRYYGFPRFWNRRPINDNDDAFGNSNSGGYYDNQDDFERPESHRDTQSLLASAGAGWGR